MLGSPLGKRLKTMEDEAMEGEEYRQAEERLDNIGEPLEEREGRENQGDERSFYLAARRRYKELRRRHEAMVATGMRQLSNSDAEDEPRYRHVHPDDFDSADEDLFDVFTEADLAESSVDNSSGYIGEEVDFRAQLYSSSSDDDDDDDDEEDEDDDDEDYGLEYDSEDYEYDHCLPNEYLKHDPTPDTQYPKPEWITINEIRQRKCGLIKHSNNHWFERNVKDSLWSIQRLETNKKLEGHTGCVNCLDFDTTGNLICSGSDDLTVCIWDWQQKMLKKRINTGHINNLIHSQFCLSDTHIITSSRDGTVRLLNIETNLSEQLLSQSGDIGQLTFITPQTIVTCGTNASVNFIDLRLRNPTKLFVVRNPKNNRSVALHSINSHPLDKHKIVVGGQSPYVFLYDLRRLKPTYCLDNFENTNNMVTSTAFNSTGDNLLISFNDDDLYVCRTGTCEIIHRYTGHRNKKTIKNCAWFGDNFVLSGSDDGHIYGWDLKSEHIVCFLPADHKGAVNYLSVHPVIPVLASSGIDHDVKVWEPTSKEWPQILKGIKPQICKNTMRRKRAHDRRNQIFHPLGDGGSDIDT